MTGEAFNRGFDRTMCSCSLDRAGTEDQRSSEGGCIELCAMMRDSWPLQGSILAVLHSMTRPRHHNKKPLRASYVSGSTCMRDLSCLRGPSERLASENDVGI